MKDPHTLVNAISSLMLDIEDRDDIDPVPVEELAIVVAGEYGMTASELLDAYREEMERRANG